MRKRSSPALPRMYAPPHMAWAIALAESFGNPKPPGSDPLILEIGGAFALETEFSERRFHRLIDPGGRGSPRAAIGLKRNPKNGTADKRKSTPMKDVRAAEFRVTDEC